jgi:uncharacterized protein involved in exopolysaccharide biosynthesis
LDFMEEEYEVDLRDYLDVMWQKKFLILGIFLISVISAGVFSSMQPPQYETRTTLLITPRITEELGENTEEGAPSVMGSTFLSTETYEKLAVTNDILLGIIEEVDLKKNGKSITVEALRGRMTPKVELAQRGRNSVPLPLLTMTVKGSDPEELKAIADAWGRLFMEKNAELLSTRTAQSYEFISERFQEVSQDLNTKEEEKRKYMEENPLGALTAELSVLKDTYQNHLTSLYEKRRELDAKKARLASLEREMEGKTASPQLDEAVLTQIALENQVYLTLEDYLIDLKVSVETLEDEVAYLEEETTKLKEDTEDRERRVNEIQMTLTRMDRDISTLKSTYDFLSEKLQEARIAKEEQLNSIRVVEAPVVPQVPSGSSKMLNIAIAGILGLFVGVFAAFFKNYVEEG